MPISRLVVNGLAINQPPRSKGPLPIHPLGVDRYGLSGQLGWFSSCCFRLRWFMNSEWWWLPIGSPWKEKGPRQWSWPSDRGRHLHDNRPEAVEFHMRNQQSNGKCISKWTRTSGLIQGLAWNATWLNHSNYGIGLGIIAESKDQSAVCWCETCHIPYRTCN